MVTLLKNGKIYIEKGTFQEALLIENGLIKHFGTNQQLSQYKADVVIDCQGKTVLPGFNDSHLHMMMTGEAMLTCELSSARSVDEVIALAKAFLDKHPTLTVLSGRGWNQDYFSDEKRLLNRHDLDKISTTIPIVFTRACFHLAVGNTLAINKLNITRDTVVEGGSFGVDDDGSLNGVFNENATSLLDSLKANKTTEDLVADFLRAANYALSCGITSVQSCDVLRSHFKETFDAIHDIYNTNKTKLRYKHQFNFQQVKDFKEYLENEFIHGSYDETFVSKGCLKLFKDGSLGARTALLRNDYQDDPNNRGMEVISDDLFFELVALATANNIQVVTHAIGNQAIDKVIDAYEKTMSNKQNPLRHTIIHNQITDKQQLERIASLSIPVIYQPVFLDYDHTIVEARVGKALASTSYAFNSLYQLNAPVSFSSDSPIEDCNPFLGIYCAVTRKGLDGNPSSGFYPNEKMAVEDAIDAYTYQSAFNEFKEHFKGKLKPGYVADCIILDQDIFSIEPEKIKDIKVLMSMIDGEIVYQR